MSARLPYDIVIADPAKNITVFVLDPMPSPADRAAAAKALLADPGLGAEQVGFVVPPDNPAGLWRLEMMGGEFCGNAARSFGLYVARRTGLSGQARLDIGISGMDAPVSVLADLDRGRAEAAMPLPMARETLPFRGAALPVYVFEGITHVIAPDIAPSEPAFREIQSLIGAGRPLDALGVMFYDSTARCMAPAVYVRATDSLVFESSCGSGSAAMGIYLAWDQGDGEFLLPLHQPGGVIEVRVEKRGGELAGVSIGGPVGLRA